MTALRNKKIASGKAILKIIPYIFLFFSCSIAKAAFITDTAERTTIDTGNTEFSILKDSIVFSKDSTFLTPKKSRGFNY